jgi:hypothetical protein
MEMALVAASLSPAHPLELRAAAGDGNCLFNSVSMVLEAAGLGRYSPTALRAFSSDRRRYVAAIPHVTLKFTSALGEVIEVPATMDFRDVAAVDL